MRAELCASRATSLGGMTTMDDEERGGSGAPEGDGVTGADRRTFDRYDVEWAVDCVAQGETFLYAAITNISQMGIFVKTISPLRIGTRLRLSFAPPSGESFHLHGSVAWINPVRADGDNPNPGMGIRFVDLRLSDRERLVEVIRTIAYLRDCPDSN